MKRARRRHGAQPVDDLLGEDVWDPALDDYDLEADDDGICALGAALADLEAMARQDAADRAAVMALGD